MYRSAPDTVIYEKPPAYFSPTRSKRWMITLGANYVSRTFIECIEWRKSIIVSRATPMILEIKKQYSRNHFFFRRTREITRNKKFLARERASFNKHHIIESLKAKLAQVDFTSNLFRHHRQRERQRASLFCDANWNYRKKLTHATFAFNGFNWRLPAKTLTWQTRNSD